MENRFTDRYKIKSSRFQNWNYSNPGYYFITICTYNKNNFFGKIIDEKMELSKSGEIVKSELLKTFEIRKNIKLNQWVIMPNHIHLLIQLFDIPVETPRGASLIKNNNNDQTNNLNKTINLTKQKNDLNETPRGASLHKDQILPIIIPLHQNHPEFFKRLNLKSNQIIPKIINQFKGSVKRICHQQNHWFSWQTRFYDHIIQNKKELSIVKNYIINNPINWQKDKLFKK